LPKGSFVYRRFYIFNNIIKIRGVKIKYFILFCLLGITSPIISASEQIPDLLIFSGQEYEIGVFPLESYFELYPNRRPGRVGINSGLIRGYRARYEISNGELILINIEVMRYGNNWRQVKNRHFRTGMKISTFSGIINLFNGEMTSVFLGFTPIYDNYIIIEIFEGNVVKIYEVNSVGYLELIRASYLEGSSEYRYISDKINELRERGY